MASLTAAPKLLVHGAALSACETFVLGCLSTCSPSPLPPHSHSPTPPVDVASTSMFTVISGSYGQMLFPSGTHDSTPSALEQGAPSSNLPQPPPSPANQGPSQLHALCSQALIHPLQPFIPGSGIGSTQKERVWDSPMHQNHHCLSQHQSHTFQSATSQYPTTCHASLTENHCPSSFASLAGTSTSPLPQSSPSSSPRFTILPLSSFPHSQPSCSPLLNTRWSSLLPGMAGTFAGTSHSPWGLPTGVRAVHVEVGAIRRRDAVIRTLASIEEVEAFWKREGGSPLADFEAAQRPGRAGRGAAQPATIRWKNDGRLAPAFWKQSRAEAFGVVPKPCRLSYLNLATLLHHMRWLKSQSALARLPSTSTVEAKSSEESAQKESEGNGVVGTKGKEKEAAKEAEPVTKGAGKKDAKGEEARVTYLLGEICERLERKVHLCDPKTAGRILVLLGDLGHPPPHTLVLLLMEAAMKRMWEATEDEISFIAHGLARVGHPGIPEWWTAAQKEVAHHHVALARLNASARKLKIDPSRLNQEAPAVLLPGVTASGSPDQGAKAKEGDSWPDL